MTLTFKRVLIAASTVAIVALGLLAPAEAARKANKPVDPFARMQPMRVTLVRDADPQCQSDCQEWLAAEGDIVAGSPAEFRRVIKALGARKVPVMVNSRGGSVEASIVIARLLRKAGLDVGVARTEFVPCSARQKCRDERPVDGAAGRLREDFAVCASSCAFILAGGQRRVAAAGSNVGVHQIKAFRTLIKVRRTYRVQTRLVQGRTVEVSRKLINEKQVSSRTTEAEVTDRYYKPIGAFLREMNVDPSLIAYIRDTPNESIHWLTPDERQATRLATDTASVRVLFAPAKKQTAMVPNASVSGVSPVTGSTIIKAVKVTLQIEGQTVAVTAQPQNLAGQDVDIAGIKARVGVYGLGLDATTSTDAKNAKTTVYAVELPLQGFCPDVAHEVLKVELLPVSATAGGALATVRLVQDGWATDFVRQVCHAPAATAKAN